MEGKKFVQLSSTTEKYNMGNMLIAQKGIGIKEAGPLELSRDTD